MRDRVSSKPNRYAVYDDAHNFLRYEYHERADEPTQAGDALNKANLLPDAVATALGLIGNPQVKDALAKLETIASLAQTTAMGAAKIATGSYVGTGTSGSSNPCSLSFDFVPQLFAIIPSKWDYSAMLLIAAEGQNTFPGIAADSSSSGGITVKISWGSVMSWYAYNENGQFNGKATYYYVAIG